MSVTICSHACVVVVAIICWSAEFVAVFMCLNICLNNGFSHSWICCVYVCGGLIAHVFDSACDCTSNYVFVHMIDCGCDACDYLF